MKNYIFLVLIFLVLIVLKVILEFTKKNNKFPYTKKKYFLTPTEQKFYGMLHEWFQDKYYIFPQIHLSSLIEVANSERKQYTYLNKIDRKSIDFVLFDKLNMLPLLAIELDDYTHTFDKRIERDRFVDDVFKIANIPITHITDCNNPTNRARIEGILNPISERVYNNIS